MTLHCFDSAIFSNAWSTPELRALLDEKTRIKGWLEIMGILADVQARYHLIPQNIATLLRETCESLPIDDALLEEARIGFETSNHSLLGLIRAVQSRCPADVGEWLCFGVTVQDITDTQTARTLKQVRYRLLSLLEDNCALLARLIADHHETILCGRTHGQPGLPISFAYKAAIWLDECQRHQQRLKEIGPRLEVGQLCGGVGSLSSLGAEALNLQKDFCQRLGLETPSISWINSRDRLAEWMTVLAMITATCDRIGHEIYNLQRPEIGELREGFVEGTVGSITMPQKRNPEISEHLGTLSRIVRYAANQMLENLIHDHERDGRAWKAEWVILPEACLASDKALSLLRVLLDKLEVNTQRMADNLAATNGFILAEAVMLKLAPMLGKQTAHQLVYNLCICAQKEGISLREALLTDETVGQTMSPEDITTCFDYHANIGQCQAMSERVVKLQTDNKRSIS